MNREQTPEPHPMTDEDHHTPATLRPTGLQGALAAVPYILGFHPEESVVAVLLCGKRVALGARMDFEDVVADVTGTEYLISSQAWRNDADGVLLIGYSDRRDATREAALEQLATALETNWQPSDSGIDDSVRIWDVVQVSGEAYRSLRCDDAACCPPRGKPYADVLADVAAAEAVWMGMPARSSRDDLRHDVTPGEQPTDAFVAGTIAALAELHAHGYQSDTAGLAARAMRRLMDDYERTGAIPGEEALGRLAALSTYGVARDVFTVQLARHNAQSWLELWAAVARASYGQVAACPVAMAGMCAWVRGDGALLVICAEEASRRWGDHTFVQFVAGVADQGIHPDRWEEMCAGFRGDSRVA